MSVHVCTLKWHFLLLVLSVRRVEEKHWLSHGLCCCCWWNGREMVRFTQRNSHHSICWTLGAWKRDIIEQNRTGACFRFQLFFFFLIPRTVVTFTWHYSCQLHICSRIGFRQPQIQEIKVEQCPQTILWDPRRMRRSKRSCAQLANQVGPQRIC